MAQPSAPPPTTLKGSRWASLIEAEPEVTALYDIPVIGLSSIAPSTGFDLAPPSLQLEVGQNDVCDPSGQVN